MAIVFLPLKPTHLTTMILHINDRRLIREIQMDFNAYYPYLRMEFFNQPHAPLSSSAESDKVSPYIKAGSVRKKHHDGAIHILPNTTVKELEEMIRKECHLTIQIYHYTLSGWIPTDVADLATLEDLNEQGRYAFHALHNVSAQAKNLY
jgi:hypothetical protein